jgi:NTE family protein
MEDIPIYNGKRKNIVVISGGGVKGLCALGALVKLKELDIIDKPDIYCGTSVGSIIILLLTIGYSALDIYEILLELDFEKLVSSNIENILDDIHLGFNTCEPIIYIINHMMKAKNIKTKITFIELFNIFNTKLIITGTCVNDASIHYFSHELTPNMEVLDAIKISISIPIIFKPYNYNNKLWIDGGCMNNYPIDLFHNKLNDVIGIYLDEHYFNYEYFEDMQSYIYQIFNCIYIGLNYNKIELYKNNTIHIKCDRLNTWDLQKEEKIKLYNIGYNLTSAKYK